jgi:Rad3-related DNA helicase
MIMRRTFQCSFVYALIFFCYASLSAQETGVKKKPAQPPAPKAEMVDIAEIDIENEMEALAYLRDISPRKAARLQEIKAINQLEYRIQIEKLMAELRKAKRLKKRDPAHYERMVKIRQLEERSQVLGRNYREAGDADKAKIETELEQILSELFDLREENRQAEVKRLEERLQELKESLEVRRKNKEKIIERRLAQLTGKSRYLDWD